jgi:hypothetical protein
MTQTVNFEGTEHQFPDDFTHDEISQALSAGGNQQQKPNALEKAIEPITSLPSTYMGMVGEAKARMGRGAKQMGEGEGLSGAGNTALGGLEYVTSPFSAPIHTIVGKPLQENFGISEALSETVAGMLLPIPKG